MGGEGRAAAGLQEISPLKGTYVFDSHSFLHSTAFINFCYFQGPVLYVRATGMKEGWPLS